MEVFYRVIKEALQVTLQPKVFMSDMAETFYSAWLCVMMPAKFRLFCSWHVDRAWRKNLSKVKGREKQVEVYKELRVLLEERDEAAFSRMLYQEINKLKSDPDTRDFGIYFEANYEHSASSWAYCKRLNAGLNTNMHLERMHGVIKHIYMEGKKPKRLDIAIHILMRFVRDKLYDRLIYMNKGKLTNKLSQIRLRHANSLSLQPGEIICGEDVWTVPSTKKSELYEVRRTGEMNCGCDLKCTECNTCIHSYVCTCHDSSIKFNMCKHIHLVAKYIGGANEHILESDTNLVIQEAPSNEEKDIILKELRNPMKRRLSEDIEECKAKLRKKFESILATIESREHVDIIEKQLQPIIPTIQAHSTKAMISTAPSTSKGIKFETQRRLFSTKKPHKKTSSSLSRPTESEQQAIAANLLLQ
ncbi:uncharacterized protein [Anabrus simplex]|uniref:uncharacterized protein n=1 Tax=Anabrus simplex TaxID=316456 RepID=UPI0034DDC2B2